MHKASWRLSWLYSGRPRTSWTHSGRFWNAVLRCQGNVIVGVSRLEATGRENRRVSLCWDQAISFFRFISPLTMTSVPWQAEHIGASSILTRANFRVEILRIQLKSFLAVYDTLSSERRGEISYAIKREISLNTNRSLSHIALLITLFYSSVGTSNRVGITGHAMATWLDEAISSHEKHDATRSLGKSKILCRYRNHSIRI